MKSMKKILLAFLCSTPAVFADWLDDMVPVIASQDHFDAQPAKGIIQKYIDQDRAEIAKLTPDAKKKESGFWGTVRGGAYRAELMAAEASLKLHQAVADFINGLSENKKEREEFIKNCKTLRRLNGELGELQKEYSDEKSYVKKAQLGTLIAAKKMHIEAKKTIMKTIKVS